MASLDNSFDYEGDDVDAGYPKFIKEEDNKNINVYSSNPTFNITNNFSVFRRKFYKSFFQSFSVYFF